MSTPISPDCVQGKCGSCVGAAWDYENDWPADCTHPCHAPTVETIDDVHHARELARTVADVTADRDQWKAEALQQYPTPDAYAAAVQALEKHRARADAAEMEVLRLRRLLGDRERDVDRLVAERDRLRRDLDAVTRAVLGHCGVTHGAEGCGEAMHAAATAREAAGLPEVP